MNGKNGRHSREGGRRVGGFTIIELLAVIAIIAVFAGVIGVALTRSGNSTATGSAQRTMSAVLAGARSQALTKQQTVFILVSADANEPETFLRSVRLATSAGEFTAPSGDEIPLVRLTGETIQLSQGVYFVPPREEVGRMGGDAAAMFSAYDQALADQGVPANEIFERTSNGKYGFVRLEQSGESKEFLYYEFNERGFTATEGGYRILFAPGQVIQGQLVFQNPNAAAGFLLRPLGSVTMISDPRGFDEP